MVQRAVEQDGGVAAAHHVGMQGVNGGYQRRSTGFDSRTERVR